MAYFPAGGQTYSLQSSISSTQTTITLSSFLVPVSGDAFTMALMNTTIAYGTISPRTSQSEFISFTGITDNGDGTYTLTGVTRGLNKTYPFTEDTDFKLPHPGGAQFILSDAPQVFNQYSVIANDEQITGRKQFPTAGTASAAVVGATYSAPTQDNEIATKKYVDDTAAFGAPIATQATAGIVILPRATQLEAGTLYSDATTANVGLVVMNSQYGARKILGYNVTAGSANAYTLDVGSSAPTTYATGAIIGFQASFTNTGNATVNVNGLGAKNLFLGSTGLFSGVITTGTYVGAVYDGTQFEITETSNLLSNANTGSTVPLRDNAGNIQVATTPVNSTDAASKSYVDSFSPTKMLIATAFETAARFTSTVTNDGATSFGATGVALNPGVSPAAGSASITMAVTQTASTLYLGSPVFSCMVYCNTITASNSGSSFFGLGNPTVATAGHTYTVGHAGFKLLKSAGVVSLYATQADGTTETASSALTTVVQGDSLDLIMKINGTSSIDYYYRKNGGALSSATNLTTNMPSGTSTTLQFSSSNNSNADRFNFLVLGATYER